MSKSAVTFKKPSKGTDINPLLSYETSSESGNYHDLNYRSMCHRNSPLSPVYSILRLKSLDIKVMTTDGCAGPAFFYFNAPILHAARSLNGEELPSTGRRTGSLTPSTTPSLALRSVVEKAFECGVFYEVLGPNKPSYRGRDGVGEVVRRSGWV